MSNPAIAFTASERPRAQEVLAEMQRRYDHVPVDEADIVVALGGDGLMLRSLHAVIEKNIPVFGTISYCTNHVAFPNLLCKFENSN